MLDHLITQLIRSLGIFVRTLRVFFQRQIVGIWTMLRRLTNFSRHATQAATGSLNAAITAAQNPSRREDYVETKRLFISKALIIKAIIALVAAAVVGYFVVWPFILSHFLTARYHVEDNKLENWSGRVIVYSDREKKIPLYAGRLENGVLQGEGKQYDEKGILIYEGSFADGLRSGQGKEYKNGILYYDGQFSGGIYEGTGERFDENGDRVYQGQFSAGIYNGRGRGFQNGKLVYEGAYTDGVAEGMGTSFYPTGETYYKGNFSAGKPDGTGTRYARDGRTIYEGSFAAGAYSGEGVLYPKKGQEIAASFEEGHLVGVVRWKRDGYLYYEGDWKDGGPAGFGRLYNRAGKVVYAGQFAGGTLDGGWLIGLGTEELREALGEGRTETLDREEGGFLLTARELGLTALCSYQGAESESSVHTVYLTRIDGDDWVALMPGMENVTYGKTAVPGADVSVPGDYAPPAGVTLAEGRYRSFTPQTEKDKEEKDKKDTETEAAMLLFPKTGTVASLAVWSRAGETLAGLSDMIGADPAANDAANAKMAELLSGLGMLSGDETGAVSAAAAQNPYYGTAAPGEALTACKSAEDAAELTDAMLAFWQYAERQTALEENLGRLEVLLTDAKGAVFQGGGSDKTVSELEEQKAALEGEIKKCAAERAKAQLRAQGVSDAELSAIDVSKAATQFDPTELKANELALVAAAYAQAAGKDAEGRDYATEVRELLLELTETYGEMQTALGYFEASAERVQSAASAYATGNGSKADWFNALSGQADRRAALIAQIAAFTGTANRLNTLTGGWVSRTYDWLNQELAGFFKVEMPEETAPAKDGEAASETAGKAPAEKVSDTPAAESADTPADQTADAPAEKAVDTSDAKTADADRVQQGADTQDTAPARKEETNG